MALNLDDIQKTTKRGKNRALKREQAAKDRDNKKKREDLEAYIAANKPRVKGEIEAGIMKAAKAGIDRYYWSYGVEGKWNEYRSLLWEIDQELEGFRLNIDEYDGGWEGPSYLMCTYSWRTGKYGTV